MRKSQSGLALVTTLMLLISVTILALSGMQSSLLQDKMVTATRDGHISLEGAEIAARSAEDFIEGLVALGVFDDTGCHYSQGNGPVDLFDDDLWNSNRTCAVNAEVKSLAERPRYFIELSGEISNNTAASINIDNYGDLQAGDTVTGFKIVSRATGASGTAQRLVVVYYGRAM